ncbi:MAG: GDP-mannose mannosyl hydrolase [Methylococcaceae bacterium]
MLTDQDFKQLIQHAPLFAIDLVVMNQKQQVLLGQRLNAPAKDYWFVPGGRVHKNETLENAFLRISQTELGVKIERTQSQLIGLYDHIYSDSFFSNNIGTHYINATHLLHLDKNQLNLPLGEQHQTYRWLSIKEMVNEKKVHPYSKIFLEDLNKALT